QREQVAFAQPVALVEIRYRGALRELVPRTGHLAIVAAIDAVADQWPHVLRNTAFELDGQVGDAAPRVELARSQDRLRRAQVDAGLAAAAVLAGGRIDGQRQVDQDLADEEGRAGRARQQQRMLAAPAEAGL